MIEFTLCRLHETVLKAFNIPLLIIHLVKRHKNIVMLAKLLAKPIELEINNKIISFSNVDDFEFALTARTSVSTDRVEDMLSSSVNELNDELKSIVSAKFELNKLVSEFPDVSSGITMRLKTLDTAIFSKEHDWRDIFIALNRFDAISSTKFKNIALKKYLQYLKNRSNIANKIKSKLEIKERIANSAGNSQIETETPSSLSTIEADATELASDKNLVRLPKANSVLLEINDGDAFDIYLADYKCKLIINHGIKFIDSDNNEYELELVGENKIGRGKDCDIKMHDSLREVSRLHLIIVNEGKNKLRLTDLSAQGTFLPKQINFE